MLFTRCPSCDTTFRVTDEALTKAGGQVRCGRCASVFNAYAELRETTVPAEPAANAASQPPVAATAAPARPPPSGAAIGPPRVPARAPVTSSQPSKAPAQAPQHAPSATRPTAPGRTTAATPAPASTERVSAMRAAEPFDDLSVAAVVAQVKLGTVEARLETEVAAHADVAAESDDVALGAQGVHAVLATEPTGDSTTAIWALESRELSPLDRRWRTGVVLALVALAAQVLHHNRAELAKRALLGPLVQAAYGVVGAPIAPRWDIAQYQILDWDATAEPNARGSGRLEITARIHNRGPRAQPYPQIQLQLKDRWEKTVGSRVFRPSEYLDTTATASALMSAGDTAQAHITVVDPGPDADGFELDVCVQAEADVLTCGNDEVFR